MKIVLVLLLSLVVYTLAARPAITRELVNEINQANAGWTAEYNSKFSDATLEDAKRLCGARKNSVLRDTLPLVDVVRAGIPDSFDARVEWPGCSSIGHIRDQSACGSCWAFGTAEAASDRICIASNGKFNTPLSATDLLACSMDDGCNGGWPLDAWEYIVQQGIVTGGDYEDKKTCLPYPMPECEHHFFGNGTRHYPDCPHTDYPTPSCPTKCQSGFNGTWTGDKHHATTAYSISSRPAAIQTEIMTNGPITVALDVYEDLLTYKSGIYRHVKGSMLGGHAVRMLGWGVENNTPYWLIANSWNADWGFNGYFKILRGSDECGIESDCCAGKF